MFIKQLQNLAGTNFEVKVVFSTKIGMLRKSI